MGKIDELRNIAYSVDRVEEAITKLTETLKACMPVCYIPSQWTQDSTGKPYKITWAATSEVEKERGDDNA